MPPPRTATRFPRWRWRTARGEGRARENARGRRRPAGVADKPTARDPTLLTHPARTLTRASVPGASRLRPAVSDNRGVSELDRGREACAGLRWREAHERLMAAEREAPLAADDLRLLAAAACMVGDDESYFSALERQHQAHLAEGEPVLAARSAIWIGLMRARGGEMGAASGWLGRGARLIEDEPPDSIEHGYLMIPTAFRQTAEGEFEAAAETLGTVAEIGAKQGHMDLFALATHEQGHVLVMAGRAADGLR